MTVVDPNHSFPAGPAVSCYWFDGNVKKVDGFPEQVLIKYDAEDELPVSTG